jgi:hypothetical protein
MKTKTIDKRTTRRSSKAEAVAREVVKRIQNGKPVNKKQIAVSSGYSVASANSQKPFNTKTFKEIAVPVIERMERLHQKAIENLDQRDLTTERMDSVVNLAKQMVHDTRLLQDKSTQNVGIQVVVYGEGDVLAKQLQQHSEGTTSSPSS